MPVSPSGIGSVPPSLAPVTGLEQRPRAEAWSIERLVAAVRHGQVRIPRFQRPLRWEAGDVRKLFDSIHRGYPIGTLLFWKNRAAPGTLVLGPLRIDAPGTSDAYHVVDGQQRMVSLAAALLAEPSEAGIFGLYFDLEQGDFVSPRKGRIPPESWLPLDQVLDSERLMAWLLDRPLVRARHQASALRVGKRIREYEVPIYVLETADEQVLRDVFARINTNGKRMQQSEVFDALLGDRTGEEPPTLRSLSGNIARSGFGRIDEKVLLKTLGAILDLDVGKGLGTGIDPARIRDGLSRLARAVEAAVVFLRRDAGIPHISLLPYKLVLAPLGRFFDRHPLPHSRSRELLARWVWRGALDGSHRGDTVALRRTIDVIGNGEHDAIQQLLGLVGKDPVAPEAGEFDFRHAASKIETLGLLDFAPRHLVTGSRIEISDVLVGAEKDRSAIPQIVRPPRGSAGDFRRVGNRILHPPAGKRRMAELLLSTGDPAVLASHAVGAEARSALADRDFERFLALREAAVRERVSRLLMRRARWGETDRPPIDSLTVPDEP